MNNLPQEMETKTRKKSFSDGSRNRRKSHTKRNNVSVGKDSDENNARGHSQINDHHDEVNDIDDGNLSQTDQWVSETVPNARVDENAMVSFKVDHQSNVLSEPATSSRRTSVSKRKKKRRGSRKMSTASTSSDNLNEVVFNVSKSKQRQQRKEKSHLLLISPEMNKPWDMEMIHTSVQFTINPNKGIATHPVLKDKAFEDDAVNSGQSGNVNGTISQTPHTTESRIGESDNGRKTTLLLPSLVFTAAGSSLDESMDTGQGLSHISYHMDELTNDQTFTNSESSSTKTKKTRQRRPELLMRCDTEEISISKDQEINDTQSKTMVKKEKPKNAKDLSGDTYYATVTSTSQGNDTNQGHENEYKPQKNRRSVTLDPAVSFYFKVCKKIGVLPLRKVIQQFGRPHMNFKNLTLTSKDMKALCLSLQKEAFASSLDFTGNFIQAKELTYIIAVLNRLHTLFQVSLCNNCLHGQGMSDVSKFLLMNDFLTRVDLSGNKLTDQDAPNVTAILKTNTTLKTLLLNHNEFREEGGLQIGKALGENTTLEDIDLSWNHLRRRGAIGIAKGLQQNTALRTVNLAWNGFGFEGCVAIGDMMTTNTTITELNLSYNRIGPPALLEILRGISGNKTLRILKMGYNPVTASFSSLILVVVQKHRESALENIDLAGVVVDKEFVSLLEEIQKDRFFIVNYEVSLPVKKMSREEMREKIGLPSAYNVDPLRMLYLLKEKMRASDFFYKINKDHDDGLQRDELYELFDEAGLPVTGSVIDKIMEFMDTNGDGTIDLGEFLQGDKRIKNMSRKQARDEQERRAKDGGYNKYSRTFQKAHIDPISLALKVDSTSTPMRQSRRISITKPDSDAEDNNHLKIP